MRRIVYSKPRIKTSMSSYDYLFEIRCVDNQTPYDVIENIISKYKSLRMVGYNINGIPSNINMLPAVEIISMKNTNLHHKYNKASIMNGNMQFEDECDDRSAEIFKPLIGSNINSLSFDNCILYKFPQEVFSALNITHINIYGNTNGLDITGLCYCESLKNLCIDNDRKYPLIDEFVIPDEISRLTKLTSLSISNCKLLKIPVVIEKLTELVSLILYFPIGSVKTENILCDFSKLTKVSFLHLSGFYGYTLPSSIGSLNLLNHLAIKDNNFEIFPEFILNLPNLKTLNVEYMEARDTPPYISGDNDIINVKFPKEEWMELHIGEYRIYWKLIYKIALMTGLPFRDLAKNCDFRINSPQFCKDMF